MDRHLLEADTAARAKYRVLLVDTFNVANDYGVDLVTALAPLVRLTVFTAKGTPLSHQVCEQLLPYFPEYWGARGKVRKLLDELAATLYLGAELWRHRRDTVHVQCFRFTLCEAPVYLLLRPFIRRLIYTAHNVLPHERKWWHRSFYSLWYRMVDAIHVLSPYTGETLVREFNIGKDKIFFAPHGNYQSFVERHPLPKAGPARAELALPEHATVILFFGLIRPYKGLDRLLRAVAAMKHRERVHLIIAGGGTPDMIAGVHERVSELGIAGQLRFLAEFVPNERLAACLGAADIVAFPYVDISQSGALLLAMTCAKTIVASDIRGFSEYVKDGASALLCDTADMNCFARTLDRAVEDSALRRRVAEAAGHVAQTKYPWSKTAARLVELYV